MGFHERGDHSTVIGEVVAVGLAEGSAPLTLAALGFTYGG